MAVKELIGLFDSNPYRDNSTRADMSGSRTSHSRLLQIDDPPPPRLARFLNHPRPHGGTPIPTLNDDLRFGSDTTLTTHELSDNDKELTQVTNDVTDVHRSPGTFAAPILDSENASSQPPIRLETPQHGYPPTILRESISSASARNRQLQRSSSHVPVPAVTLFARGAATLYLPKLDDYLASLNPPKFTVFEKTPGEKCDGPTMFPPMERLAASGLSIEDLEHNSRRPGWRKRGTIFSAMLNMVLGFTGSSALATYYSLQGLFNTVQVFALLLSTIVPVHHRHSSSKWRNLLLGRIPNFLALNFASTVTQALLYLIIFMAIAAVLLFHFHRSTSRCEHYHTTEGLQEPEPKGTKWGLLIVTFFLTVIYLPLSTLAVHVLVWSQDLWVVPNPYVNATTNPPIVPSIGPPDAFRDPLDFCWTTTMEKSQINFAPILIIISALVFLTLTVWFPLRLRKVIRYSAPKVDPYTELGHPRSKSDMDREYHRLLSRDRNPFSFLYNGFRRDNGHYQSTYLFAKLSTLLIVAVIDADNCLFRSLSRHRLAIARQVLLLISTLLFFALQCYFAPFMDPVNNASEWISRLNYIATAAVALAIALEVPRQDIINGPVLYAIYAITYGLTLYFLIIDTSLVHRVVKRIACRIDFSLDIFSPRLDTPLALLHIRRRIWQESLTTLLLTSSACQIPKQQRMIFAQASDSAYPPVLLDFEGTPGERHVENLKILRDIGTQSYTKAVTLVYGSERHRFKLLQGKIQKHFVGPDCYWKDPQTTTPGCSNFFGNTWWIPFPPTLVMKYDNGKLAVLNDIPEFEAYIAQNSSPAIRRRREIRTSVRVLDGQTVLWPYEHVLPIGAYSLWCCGRGRYTADTTTRYQTCVLRIKRRGTLLWGDTQLGSGFDIELIYAKNVRVDGTVIGLNDDLDLTLPLSRFLFLNQELITQRLDGVLSVLADYRVHHRREAKSKDRVLTYKFLSFVYDHPRDATSLVECALQSERDQRVTTMIATNTSVFQGAHERLTHVSTSPVTRWWYLFWDDLWRRNHGTIASLQRHATDFDPHYPTSIAYSPLPRPALEAFLVQRGLLSHVPKWSDVFHTGFLNKLYLRLNEAAFTGSSQGIFFHIGDGDSERDMLHVDLETQVRLSTTGVGGGTDYDEASIQARPMYKWEGLLEDPIRRVKSRKRRWFAKMGAWFGITPLWNSGIHSRGLSVDVRLEDGRYVLIDGSRS